MFQTYSYVDVKSVCQAHQDIEFHAFFNRRQIPQDVAEKYQ